MEQSCIQCTQCQGRVHPLGCLHIVKRLNLKGSLGAPHSASSIVHYQKYICIHEENARPDSQQKWDTQTKNCWKKTQYASHRIWNQYLGNSVVIILIGNWWQWIDLYLLCKYWEGIALNYVLFMAVLISVGLMVIYLFIGFWALWSQYVPSCWILKSMSLCYR